MEEAIPEQVIKIGDLPPITPKKPGYIYLIKIGEVYKIGQTFNLKSRIHQYRTMNFHKVEVILYGQVWDHQEVEKNLHAIFVGKRIRGEWFNLEPEDIESIKEHLAAIAA